MYKSSSVGKEAIRTTDGESTNKMVRENQLVCDDVGGVDITDERKDKSVSFRWWSWLKVLLHLLMIPVPFK